MDLDVLHPNRTRGGARPGVRMLPLIGLGRYVNPHSYDAVVYAIGNSPHHVATYEKLLVHTGIVWLHDVRIPTSSGTTRRAMDRAGRLHRRSAPPPLRHEVSARALTDWSVALCDRYGLG